MRSGSKREATEVALGRASKKSSPAEDEVGSMRESEIALVECKKNYWVDADAENWDSMRSESV